MAASGVAPHESARRTTDPTHRIDDSSARRRAARAEGARGAGDDGDGSLALEAVGERSRGA